MNKATKSRPAKNPKGEILSDPRFSHLVKDPRYKNLQKNDSKVKIDKRFQPMFDDKKFKVKHTVDKYGRRVNKTSTDDLKKYYDVHSTDEEYEIEQKQLKEKQIKEASSHEVNKKSKKNAEKKTKDDTPVSENDDDDDDENLLNLTSMDIMTEVIDYVRGGGLDVSDSSDGLTSGDEDAEELHIEHAWSIMDHDAETTDVSTRRLAVCNMNWDRVRASDIMVLCSSFLPPGGSIRSVKIYRSEYGKKRLAEEEKHGPPELTKKKSKRSESSISVAKDQDTDAEEGDEYDMEKLRQYQLNRLKYYYAVVECDSVKTADKIYQECDGTEYESSATKVDLRFIPDDITFHDKPHDVCRKLPEPGQYKPRKFTTTALQQSNVELTWDETSVERKELSEKLLSGNVKDVKDADLRKIVAYSSEEDGDLTSNPSASEDEARKTTSHGQLIKSKKKIAFEAYKALLQEIAEEEEKAKRNKIDKEVSWDLQLSKNRKNSDQANDETRNEEMSTIDRIMEKRRERKQKRRQERMERKRAKDEDSDDLEKHGIDMNDPYFAEEFADGKFKKAEPSSIQISAKELTYQSDLSDKEENKEELQKKQELELLMDDNNKDEKQHFSLMQLIDKETESKTTKKKEKKNLKKKRSSLNSSKQSIQDNFKVKVDDERFKAVYKSPNYNIDPSDPHFKNTKGIQEIMREKQKRILADDFSRYSITTQERIMAKKKKEENRSLVKNLKRKLEQAAAK